MKKRRASISGFSLVEVTLALGVVVFCLVTILGILAVGINSTHVSAVQTTATNILTAVAADLESTPNTAPPTAKDSATESSPVYGISLPANGGTGNTVPTPIYIAEDGTVANSAGAAFYQLNVWVTAPAAPRQETLVRLLLSWPAQQKVFSASGTLIAPPQNFVENVLALNRT